MSTARWITFFMGLLFAALGIWGLIPAAGDVLLGVFAVNTALCVTALVIAALLLYGTLNAGANQTIAGSLGLLLVLIGAAGLLSSDLFGLMPMNGWNIGLFLGAGSVLIIDWLSPPAAQVNGTGRRPLR